jgi:hypothetical protein
MKETFAQATGLIPKEISIIYHIKQQGLGHEQISQELCIDPEVLKQFLPEVIEEIGETHKNG